MPTPSARRQIANSMTRPGVAVMTEKQQERKIFQNSQRSMKRQVEAVYGRDGSRNASKLSPGFENIRTHTPNVKNRAAAGKDFMVNFGDK